MFYRDFRRQERAKFKIYLSFEGAGASVVALSLGRWWCPLGAGGRQAFDASGPAGGWLWSYSGVFPAFALFPAFLYCFAFQICFISHFKGFLARFWGADACLYGFGSLRGLWGFCVRERLGGFGACGVFRLSFSSLFLSCPAFVLLLSCFPAWLLLLVLSCFLGFVGLAVGFLSLSDGFRNKKKGRVLRPFLRCLFALILLDINPYIFLLGFHKMPPYLHMLSGCGRFSLSLPAFVLAALQSSNTGRYFRGLPALLG